MDYGKSLINDKNKTYKSYILNINIYDLFLKYQSLQEQLPVRDSKFKADILVFHIN